MIALLVPLTFHLYLKQTQFLLALRKEVGVHVVLPLLGPLLAPQPRRHLPQYVFRIDLGALRRQVQFCVRQKLFTGRYVGLVPI